MAEKGHTELLPCPFCGGEPRPIRKHKNANGKSLYTIGCGNYCCVTKKDTIEKTKASWNTRAAVNTVDGLVKALERAQKLVRLVTVRQVIESGDDAIEAAGINPWAMNEGLAEGHERIDTYFIDAALESFRSLQNGGAE
jgi:hypothetical protein